MTYDDVTVTGRLHGHLGECTLARATVRNRESLFVLQSRLWSSAVLCVCIIYGRLGVADAENVCVCLCVCVRESGRKRDGHGPFGANSTARSSDTAAALRRRRRRRRWNGAAAAAVVYTSGANRTAGQVARGGYRRVADQSGRAHSSPSPPLRGANLRRRSLQQARD